jgi:hypothetical protein
MEMELSMFDRLWFGDLALAVLLTLPLVGLARTHSPPDYQSAQSAPVSTASADRLPTGRISLLG